MPRQSHSTVRRVFISFIGAALIAGFALAPAPTRAAGQAGDCPNDSKLLNGGPTLVEGSGPGTWWGLVHDGLLAAGFDTEAEQLAYLNGIFGTTFSDIDSAKAFNLAQVDAWDANGNGYVCAFELRGTRAHFRDPYLNLTAFGIDDDRVRK